MQSVCLRERAMTKFSELAMNPKWLSFEYKRRAIIVSCILYCIVDLYSRDFPHLGFPHKTYVLCVFCVFVVVFPRVVCTF